ncbi:MAG: TRAP transporter large permease subunit [Alphaproteobacteria bacterium]|nr:TRAP transporter large permease subunit [Alphaproteobacteria bacterium]
MQSDDNRIVDHLAPQPGSALTGEIALEETQPTNRVARALRALEHAIAGVVTVALVALVAIIFANVVGRYIFNSSLTWAAEAAQWLFVAIIFLAIPLAHRASLHLSITYLVDKLPERPRTAVNLAGEVVVAYTTIMLLFGAKELIEAIGGTNHVLGLPAWVKYAVIPISCIAALIFTAFRGYHQKVSRWRGPMAIALATVLYLAINTYGLVSIRGLEPASVMGAGFLLGMAMGIPVSFAMLFGAFMANQAGGLLPDPAVVQNMVNGSGKFLLLAIPFFITAGALMNAGGLTRRLMDFAFTLVGHLRGGFAQVNVMSSMLYGGISGSSYSEAALGTKVLVPQMVRHGYSAPLSCAVTAASAVMPNIIPPSIALLILAAVSNLSVGDLWLAGVGPGILIAVSLMLAVYIVARVQGHGMATARADGRKRVNALVHAIPVLLLAVVILGGIRFGVVTPTEAGVLALIYAWLLGMVGYRAYGPRELWKTLRTSAIEAAMIGLLIGVAAPFAFVLVTQQVPQSVTAFVTGLSSDPLIVLLIANLVLLFFGMFLDIGAAILILTPLLMPLMVSMGIDPIHFGLIIVVNLMMGGLTPPVGMLVFVTATISRTPVHLIFRAMVPFFLALIAALMVVTFVPAVPLGLGWLIGGR